MGGMRAYGLLAAAMGLGCGPAPLIVAAGEPDGCGQTDAERIAALSDDERLTRIVPLPGDPLRLIFEIGAAPAREPGTPPPPVRPRRLISTDACGDDEAALPGDRVADATAGALLTCHEATGTVNWVDPNNLKAAHPLFASTPCAAAVSGEYAMAVDLSGPAPAIVRAPLSGGEPEVVVASIAALDPLPVAVEDGVVVTLQPIGRLVGVDIATGEVVESRDDIADFRASPDGRFRLVQRGVPDPEPTPSEVWLIDRQAASETLLMETALAWSPQPWFSDYVLLASEPGQPWRVFARASGDELVLPQGHQLRGAAGERVWIAPTPLAYGTLHELSWHPRTGETILLYEGPGYASGSPEGLLVYTPSAALGIQLGTVSEIPWTGGPPIVVAQDVGWHRRRLGDGRWISVQAAEDGETGTLLLHDTDGSRVVLDEAVAVHAPALAATLGPEAPLVYAVTDGARSGLYRHPLHLE